MTHVGSSVLSSKAPSPKPADLSLSTLDVSRELRSLPLVLVKDHDVEKSEMWNVSLTLSGPVSLESVKARGESEAGRTSSQLDGLCGPFRQVARQNLLL
jgi:hypothetical protein